MWLNERRYFVRFKLLGNTHIPHYKNTANMKAIPMPSPKEVLLPLSQHIGAPATPIVSVGDEVKIGQKIAEANGYVSSPIYASVSGKVTKIEDYLRPDGRVVPAIRIVSDGEMTVYEGITAPTVNDLDTLISASRESGLVGLGGAGFPMSVKLDALKKGIIDTILINAAECEPYITCDTHTMKFESEWVEKGIALFEKYTDVKNIIIGIEKNKPECIKDMKKLFKGNTRVSVSALPEKYPQGGEKILIYNTTKRIVPEGKLPADVGVIVINVTSLAVFAKYVETGMPLVNRCVTFDGSAAKEPKNVIVPIGTAISEVIDFCGGLSEPCGKVLYGGPMMGTPAASLSEPVVKTTGAITVFNREDSILPEPTACIRCGRCTRSCPLNLIPDAFSKALEAENEEEKIAILDKNKIMLCMECGCCSYVCPANRPLVQNNRLAKGEWREYQSRMSKLNK
ncbi:MAG: electron transport complex subunit RsxC [Clostridia bacterium]|nr:electron transport complex subunit RsxC [Clostridia bacterium]